MGNCLLRGSQGKTVEMVKPDGKVLEYRNRVTVRKVLADFSGYGVSENLRQPPLWHLLPPETTLRSGRSYFLVPLCSPSSSKNNNKKKKVRFEDEVMMMDSSSSLDQHQHAVSSSSSSNPPRGEEVVRIKMVVSKKELVEMMGRQSDHWIREKMRFPDSIIISSGGQRDNDVVDNQEELG